MLLLDATHQSQEDDYSARNRNKLASRYTQTEPLLLLIFLVLPVINDLNGH